MRALVLVDLQNDFMPGGALVVPGGHEVVAPANRLGQKFELIVATQDWHPPDHGSFAASHPGTRVGDTIDLNGIQQILWPVHCVRGTHGAELHRDLDRSRIEKVFRKGTEVGLDSYSTFFDNAHRQSTGLADHLRGRGVEQVYLAGLATDYCVKFSVLDALGLGFETYIVLDACRGIDRRPGDVDRAVEEIAQAGGHAIDSQAV